MTDRQRLLLHLSLIPGVGPVTIQQLLRLIHFQELYAFSKKDLEVIARLSKNSIHKVFDGLQDSGLLERELELLKKHDVQWVSYVDSTYPFLLKHIHAPPAGLYIKGKNVNHEKGFAIVGSRAANYYARKVMHAIVPDLVTAGTTIVSGGAFGVDAIAHEMALENQGTTVAVLGSGLLKPYPFQHKKLFEDIVSSGGSLISIFALQQEALPGNFPARNRIIAGLSTGCLVVQAGKRSGALITARYALQEGREVFAVPGQITDMLSTGCHTLIKEGATMVTSAHDIFNHLPMSHNAVDTNVCEVPSKKLTEKAKRIWRLCREPQSADEIAESLSLTSSQVQQILFDMQLQKAIEQDFTGLWVAL